MTGPGESAAAVDGGPAAAASPVSAEGVYAALADFIGEEDFVCLGARAALRRNTIVHHHFGRLGTEAAVEEHLAALYTFLQGFEPSARSFTSFVATFEGPRFADEQGFETTLWRHLQALHDRDSRQHPWSTEYDADPSSTNFGFSVGGHPFFVVGLHPGASRPSRRFGSPTLVFNSHLQFNALGMNFFKLRGRIRKREKAWHGSVNPSFLAYKDEARHYSGRMTDPEWRCPFTPNPAAEEPAARAVEADPR
ncbi:guanitoxin biosynthesis heme-dependent pre-guanitoxin N-hydroxylase GntA [Streptomyces sp. NPDC092296]|uniref:guanitoxin biosynthesis heme-dependent pre-guanitoxin N-hydroxylase GntA n=1 Tax=Streptomyces sp. NPDC092296 TaxID=3366012 RepID=UPI0037FCED48